MRFWYSGWRSDRSTTLGLAGAGVGTVTIPWEDS